MNTNFLVSILEIIINIFETALIYYWGKAFSKSDKKNKVISIGINVFVFTLLFLGTFIIENPLIWILINFTCNVIMQKFYNESILLSIFLAIGFCLIGVLSDTISAGILMATNSLSLQQIIINKELKTIGNLIAKLIALIIVGNIYFKKKNLLRIPKSKKGIYLFILPIASIVLLYQMSRYNYSFLNIQDFILNSIAITGIVAANISVFVFFEKESQYEDQKKRESFLKEQLNNQREYYKALELSQEEIQRLRHDMKNSFIALLGYIKEKKLLTAENYLVAFTEAMENTQKALSSGYSAIDALINAKINKAKENEIEIKHKIILPPNIAIDEMDLCIILGNALDNAIEAIRLVNKKEKQIILNIYIYGEELFIYVENSMQGNLVLKNGLLLSTKKDKENHGYGLENVEQILKIYDGEMHYKSENNVFRLYITVKQPNYV